MDGYLQLNFAILSPEGRKIAKFNAWFPSLMTENAKIKRWITLFSVRTNIDSADGATLLSKVLAQTN